MNIFLRIFVINCLLGTTVMLSAGTSEPKRNIQVSISTDKIAYMPGDVVKISVKLKNDSDSRITGGLRITVAYDMDSTYIVYDKQIVVEKGQEIFIEEMWKSPAEELWGCEARVEFLLFDRITMFNRRVFVVTDNIPKVAANYGIVSPYDYKTGVPDPIRHIFDKCEEYAIPIMEQYCWTPSNWGRIYPSADRWICGQMRYPMTFKELEKIVEHAHSRGMKILSYAMPSPTGVEGYRWVKEHPDGVFYKDKKRTIPEITTEQIKAWDSASTDPTYTVARRNELVLWLGWEFCAVNNLVDAVYLDDGIDQWIKILKNLHYDGIRWDGHPEFPYHPVKDDLLRRQSGGALNTLFYDRNGNAITANDPDRVCLDIIKHVKERLEKEFPGIIHGYNIQAVNSVYPDDKVLRFANLFPLTAAEIFPGAVILDEKHFVELGSKRSAGMHNNWSTTRKFWVNGNNLLRSFGAYHYTGSMPYAGTAVEPFLLHVYSLAYASGARTFGSVTNVYDTQSDSLKSMITFAQRYAQYLFHPSSIPMEPESFVKHIEVTASRPVIWEDFGKYIPSRGKMSLVAQVWNNPLEEKMELKNCKEPPMVDKTTLKFIPMRGLPLSQAKAYVLSPEWEKWQIEVPIDLSKPAVEIEIPPFRYWAIAILQYPMVPQPEVLQK